MNNKETYIKLLKHPLITGSSIILLGSFLGNLLNYLFTLIIGRSLTPTQYGIYSVASSIILLFTIFQNSFSTIFSRFSAKYSINKDTYGINRLFFSGLKMISIFSLATIIVLLLGIDFISRFLKIEDLRILLLIYLSVITLLFSSLPFGILQGKLKFLSLSIYTLANPVVKIAFGVLFIMMGLEIFGVMVAVFISMIVPFLYVTYELLKDKKIHFTKGAEEKEYINEFKKHTRPLFLATFGITFISTGDIILVKHFFDPQAAGQYAALAIMGKAIFYLTTPIYFVFFPIVTQKKEKGEKILSTLILALVIIGIISVVLALIYNLWPHLIVRVFFPSQSYKILAKYIGIYSIFALFYSIALLFHNLFLSIGKVAIYKINLAAAAFFTIGIWIYHTGF